jgi:hypothetical protein
VTRREAARLVGVSLDTVDRRVRPLTGERRTPSGEIGLPAAALAEQLHDPWPGRGRPGRLDAAVVSRIVSERNAGSTFAAIAAALNDDGVATAHGGRRWWPATVRKVLEAQRRPRRLTRGRTRRRSPRRSSRRVEPSTSVNSHDAGREIAHHRARSWSDVAPLSSGPAASTHPRSSKARSASGGFERTPSGPFLTSSLTHTYERHGLHLDRRVLDVLADQALLPTVSATRRRSSATRRARP